jgi:hypothetical protein
MTIASRGLEFWKQEQIRKMQERDEQIKSEYDKIKQENNYAEGKPTNEPKSERDLFRVLVGEDGLVKQIKL